MDEEETIPGQMDTDKYYFFRGTSTAPNKHGQCVVKAPDAIVAFDRGIAELKRVMASRNVKIEDMKRV